MPKSEKDETLQTLSNKIFATMLDELVLDAALQAHHEVARARAMCSVCGTRYSPIVDCETTITAHFCSSYQFAHRCGQVHVPKSAAEAASSASGAGGSRAETPSSAVSNDAGTSTPVSTKGDGNLILECVSCSRQIASNRYAPHLASCMGLATARRNAARAGSKAKVPSDAGRSASPGSEGGNASDERVNGKSKFKSKDHDSLKRKRAASPQISPNKKTKKGKPMPSPVSRVKADPDSSGLPTNSHFSPSTSSHSKVPSKLRDSSTAPLIDHSSSSRESSPGALSIAATPSSSFASQSPTRPLNGKAGRGRPPVKGVGPPRRASPLRPPPVQHVPEYLDIDHANETGSSTDTDDSDG
ncbi:hypothetical protein CVT24_003815 [Panaeolus cyanescens]|uniref:SAGA-associated factor 11 n=1 Tax=Panaeolus cyanescens TaxID=181874 RepID=A0A409YXE0_9AGAR|nr:hypothetical protein CVT24_003815 [Panaeolus cyanescens]